jgi:tetratricopeptide (TPR) repeat protein
MTNSLTVLRYLDDLLTVHEAALGAARSTGNRHGEGGSLNNLGNAYHELRRFEEAVDCYQQSLAIYRETGDRHGEGQTLDNLGSTYQELRLGSRMLARGGGGHARCRRPRGSRAPGTVGCEHPVLAPPPRGLASQAAFLIFPVAGTANLGPPWVDDRPRSLGSVGTCTKDGQGEALIQIARIDPILQNLCAWAL